MKTHAFTLIELLVVISIIALLIGILLPALSAARKTTRQVINTTQVRGVHQSLILFSQGNNTFYPGLSSTGAVSDADVAGRFTMLLSGHYFPGSYAISPSETKTPWTTGVATTEHYSYALAAIGVAGQRRQEWRDTSNSEAVVISDRAIGNPSGANIRSVHTNPASGTREWRGSMGWNDNHVSFEPDEVVSTRMGSSLNPADNVFDPTSTPDDALQVYAGTDVILE